MHQLCLLLSSSCPSLRYVGIALPPLVFPPPIGSLLSLSSCPPPSLLRFPLLPAPLSTMATVYSIISAFINLALP